MTISLNNPITVAIATAPVTEKAKGIEKFVIKKKQEYAAEVITKACDM